MVRLPLGMSTTTLAGATSACWTTRPLSASTISRVRCGHQRTRCAGRGPPSDARRVVLRARLDRVADRARHEHQRDEPGDDGRDPRAAGCVPPGTSAPAPRANARITGGSSPERSGRASAFRRSTPRRSNSGIAPGSTDRRTSRAGRPRDLSARGRGNPHASGTARGGDGVTAPTIRAHPHRRWKSPPARRDHSRGVTAHVHPGAVSGRSSLERSHARRRSRPTEVGAHDEQPAVPPVPRAIALPRRATRSARRRWCGPGGNRAEPRHLGPEALARGVGMEHDVAVRPVVGKTECAAKLTRITSCAVRRFATVSVSDRTSSPRIPAYRRDGRCPRRTSRHEHSDDRCERRRRRGPEDAGNSRDHEEQSDRADRDDDERRERARNATSADPGTDICAGAPRPPSRSTGTASLLRAHALSCSAKRQFPRRTAG